MSMPDTNTVLIIVFNCAVYAAMYFRRGKKETAKEAAERAILLREHREMYADYRKTHGISSNGERTKEAT